MVGVMARLRAVVRTVRPVDPEFAAALARRWAKLPETARTPGQTLGRHGVGCEGTHGVFPKCDLACTPCYHSRDANQVRVDGPHTLAQVQAQVALLREQRGPRAHAQLIGGEVSLLDPDDHATAQGRHASQRGAAGLRATAVPGTGAYPRSQQQGQDLDWAAACPRPGFAGPGAG
jgi:hypothetical protein